MKHREVALGALLAAALAGAGVAQAGPRSHVCARTHQGTFQIDGRLDDWRGFRGTGVAKQSRDRAFVMRCAYDGERLFLSVNVRDERVIRTRRGRPKGEDHLALKLRAPGGRPIRLRALPGSRTAPPKPIGVPEFVRVESSLQEWGLSFELSVKLERLAGWGRTTPALLADVAYRDADRARQRRIQDTIRFRGRLVFSDAWAVHRQFMRAAGLSERDVRLDTLADVDPGAGAERIIAGGRLIGILSDVYFYLQLPVQRPEDVLEVKTVDFDGSGRHRILAHFRQRGGGGARELVGVWQVTGDHKFQRLLAFEVGKQMDGRRLKNEWSLVPRGRGKTKGVDIRVKAAEAVGWSQDSYQEVPAQDVRPILLPWAEQKTVTYRFEAGGFVPLEPRR